MQNIFKQNLLNFSAKRSNKKTTNKTVISYKNLSILLLFSILSLTPTNIKTSIPEIKGLYEIFSPDVIGIGQALKTKGWIENVYDNASSDNEAKIVISRFWHKISETDQLKTTAIAPVSELTPELLGRIINYTRKYRLANNEERESLAKEKEAISNDWFAKCQEYITKKLPTRIQNIIERTISKLKENEAKNKKELDELQPKEKDLKVCQKKLDSEISKLKTEKSKLLLPNENYEKIKESIAQKEKERDNYVANLKKIEELKKENPKFIAKISKEENKLKNLNNLIGIDKNNIKIATMKILLELENLIKSESFIPETTEAILWAFFEDKFTLGSEEKSLNNLNLCLNQIDNKKIESKKYDPNEYEVFKKELASLDDKQKIEKLINEYDRSNYANIKISRIQIVPPMIVSIEMSYKSPDDKETKPFATCFEAAMLDTLNILLYNPKTKIYDTSLLPENTRQSEFFKNIIYKVFIDSSSQEEEGKEKEESDLIDPQKINSNYQQWINLIEEKKLDLGIEYWSPKNARDKDNYYNLYTTLENLIKILNATFNLGLDIKVDPDKPEILEINNFDIIEKEIDSNLKAQDFYNKIFEFISKKLSTNDREVQFSCNLEKGPNNFKIYGNTITINSCYGKVNTKIKYKEDYLYNTEFDLQINDGHAKTVCNDRESKGLRDIYSYTFTNLLEPQNTKLLTTFISLMNENMATKSTLPIENLIFYCFKSKTVDQKLNILKMASKEALFENSIFDPLIQKFIENIFQEERLASDLLSFISYLKEKNKIIDKIIETAIKKTPYLLLLSIVNSQYEENNWTNQIGINLANELNFNEQENFYTGNIICSAHINGYKEIFKIIFNKEKLKNIDKFYFHAIIGDSKEAENYLVIPEDPKTIKKMSINYDFIDAIGNIINENLIKNENFINLILKLDDNWKLIPVFAHKIGELNDESEGIIKNILSKNNYNTLELLNMLNRSLNDNCYKIISIIAKQRPAESLQYSLRNLDSYLSTLFGKPAISNEIIEALNNNQSENEKISSIVEKKNIIENIKYKYNILSRLNNKFIKKVLSENPKESLFGILSLNEIEKSQEEKAIEILNKTELNLKELDDSLKKLNNKDDKIKEIIYEKIKNNLKKDGYKIENIDIITKNIHEEFPVKIIEIAIKSNKDIAEITEIISAESKKILSKNSALEAIIIILDNIEKTNNVAQIIEKLSKKLSEENWIYDFTPLLTKIKNSNNALKATNKILENKEKINNANIIIEILSEQINSKADAEKVKGKLKEYKYKPENLTKILGILDAVKD